MNSKVVSKGKKGGKESSDYAYIKDGSVYLKPFLTFPERKIGVVKESDELAIAYFINRFELFRKKVDDLVKSIDEAQNKGSFLMKLLHLKSQMGEFNAIGDFSALLEKLEEAEEKINELIDKNRIKNLEAKTILIQEFEALMNNKSKIEKWKDFSLKFNEIKDKWIKIGSVAKEHQDILTEKFILFNELYIEKKNAYYDDLTKIISERVKKYEQIIADAETILEKGITTPEVIRQIKTLRFQWKKIGMIPKEKATELKNIFQDTISSISHLLVYTQKYDKAEKPWDDICKEVEKLAGQSDKDAVAKLKEIQERWRNLGKLTTKNSKKLVMRFIAAVDKVYELFYLDKEAVRKFGDFFERSELEQTLIKIKMLKEYIAYAEENKGNMADSDPKSQALLKRKVYARKEILKDLTDKVTSKKT